MMFCQRGANHNREQTHGNQIQEGYSDPITEITTHFVEKTPVQNQHNVQTRIKPILS